MSPHTISGQGLARWETRRKPMLSIRTTSEAGRALADKGFGLTIETVGTIWGNERLKRAGRTRQDAATERLRAIEEEAKATKLTAEASAEERLQRRYQDPKRSAGRAVTDGPSVTRAAAEGINETVKQVAGAVSGDDDRQDEGRVQKAKARDEAAAAGHEAKAKAHREKADVLRSASDRLR